MKGFKEVLPGLFFALALAIAATLLGKLVPIIGGPVFGIVLGILISSIWGKRQKAKKGLTFASKKILQWSIVMLGGGLSLAQVYKAGLSSLYVMIFTLSAAFILAYGVGRLMLIPVKLTSLIGMGTAICGGSAIAAVAPIIEAEDEEIAYSISTVFMFNVMAVLIFPPLGHLLGFSDNAFGLWAGLMTEAGKFFIVVALSAIGLNSDLKQMLKTGFKPMLLGLIVWAGVAVVSLIVQFSTGQI